ncbi:MAG: zeta toxin family protein, partial [Candidatus Melainabacteria bacterium]|nr:zeta toxin family protein [Candidatus Melainabacteria bacterium]
YGAGAETRGRRLDIVIGAPGSGKSSMIAHPLAEANGSMIVDADLAKPRITGYADGLGADAVHEASSRVAAELLERGFQNGDNMVALKLGKSERSLAPLIERARESGYEVNLHVAELPVQEYVARTYNRAFPENGGVGQWVNPTFAADVGTKPMETFTSLISRPGYIDNFSHYDTNVPRNTPAILIREGATKKENAA